MSLRDVKCNDLEWLFEAMLEDEKSGLSYTKGGANPQFLGPGLQTSRDQLIHLYSILYENLLLISGLELLFTIYYICSSRKLSVTRPLSFRLFRYDSIRGSPGLRDFLRF